ncbi:MAG: hypothetical protein MI794_10220 [Pseudomonadales bacterium]|uniref:hypothetical protein n=1 Tax=Marinobacter xestospongiae TaxID=994319 RepID=UPI002005E559|nr:hypothetical protein [Marinobacter xestospongiae]MCG8518353.1 hypothetical protein [Pseudomonadales bacterium]MCK7566683.1 hypothetical protein [Marinobacter xestospongiae]
MSRTPQKNWVVDLPARTARHHSGFLIQFEGRPGSSHFGGHPTFVPSLSHLETVALIREGFQAFKEAYADSVSQTRTSVPVRKKLVLPN